MIHPLQTQVWHAYALKYDDVMVGTAARKEKCFFMLVTTENKHKDKVTSLLIVT